MWLKKVLLFYSLSLFLLGQGCKNIREAADVLYVNGIIWTGDTANPEAAVLAVKNGKILYVGNDAQLYKGPETKVEDLEGKLLLPGFIDNHTHFLTGGFQLASVDLRSARTPAEFIQKIADFAANQPKGRWILGGDWDHEAWGGELPQKGWIDSVSRHNPVFVSRLDGHMALANSLAIQRAGIKEGTKDVAGGTIVRDAMGSPAGVFKDEAMGLISRVIPPPGEKELDEALERAMGHAVSLGITQIHDVGSMGGFTDLNTFRRNVEKLQLRIYSMVPLSQWKELKQFIAKNGRGDERLRWGALKGFVDGSLGSTTAWFYTPYVDEPETAGFMVNDSVTLREWILSADAEGLHVAVHAIGDRANDWLIDVYSEVEALNGPRDRRFRIEHAQHLTPRAIALFAELGVIPSMQPYHAIDDGRWAEKRIGPQRIKTTYAFRSLLDAYAPLTFGSDWTVAPLSPLEGIYAAVTRRTLDGKNPSGWVPGEKISLEEALKCYTINNAYAGFQENQVGKLKAGYFADFVILTDNILQIPPEQIRKVKVLKTVVAGKQVYGKQDF